MEIITPKPPEKLPDGRNKVFTCRCREDLRVWEVDLKSEKIVFDTGAQDCLCWFVCVSCGQKTYLSPSSRSELITLTGPYIPYK